MQQRKNSHDSAAYSFCGSYALLTSASSPSFMTPPLMGAPPALPVATGVPPPLHAVTTRPRIATSPRAFIERLIFPPLIPPPSREREDRALVVRCLPLPVRDCPPDWPGSSRRPRVERVSESVSHQVERERDRERDESREQHHPPGHREDLAGVRHRLDQPR